MHNLSPRLPEDGNNPPQGLETMARQLRIQFEGTLYHIISRGNEKMMIFFDEADRIKYLNILSTTVERFNWLCHVYCLMGNHYHLMIETPDANLAKGMKFLNQV